MSAAQLLLRKLLDQAGGGAETGYLLVMDGEGLENLPERVRTSAADYAVHRVSTELGLRHLLWKAQGAPLIAVLPEALAKRVQKAPDLLRPAHKQRVCSVLTNDVLELVLGVRVVGADAQHMQQLALEYVDKLAAAISRRTLPTVVDKKLLTELLVDVSVGEHVQKRSPAELLATWVQQPPDWPTNVSRLVRDALPAFHGDEGRVLAWALEAPETRMRELVVHGALLTVDAPELPKAAWGPLWSAATEPPLEMDRRILRRALTRLAEETLAALGDAATPMLVMADRIGRESMPNLVSTSRVLPLAFASRGDALAKQAASGKAIGAGEIAWLASHGAAPMHRAELAVLEEIARLSRYLDEPLAPKSDVLEQARDYQRDGAFADLAMARLRRALAQSAQHHVEANAVLAACRERRDRENRQLAETLSHGYEAALHREGLVPLHRVWKRVVAPLWQKEPSARLFLIVLDGCSYPVFLELLHALAQDNTFPLGVRPDEEGRVAGVPALAPLPTVTSHARGAIFLGELPNDPLVAETVFRDKDEAKTDKARFNQNASLGGRSRKLFLKADLADGGQALRATLADPSVDVVGVVFNAIDDQIGSSNLGAPLRIGPEDIAGFKPALRVALEAGRKVLLTADHGHSPYVDKSRRAGAGKTPRFVALSAKDPVPEGFLEIDVACLGGPPERRAFAWRAGAYLGGPQVGFHGGCSLEEMVVPLAWIERDGLAADEPAWWYGRGALAEAVMEPRPIAPPIVTPHPSDELPAAPKPQLSLFDPADKADMLPLPATVRDALSKDEKAVLVLLRENGSARASELAERLKKNSGRFNGLMVMLNRKLQAAEHPLFSSERLPDGQVLYRFTAKES